MQQVLAINNYTLTIFSKKLIFFWIKDTRILLFLVEHYTIQTDIIGYHLLPNSMSFYLKYFEVSFLMLCKQISFCIGKSQ